MEPEDRPDPMAKVFPKVTKCTFHNYGPSGTVEKKDGLCVLPLNIINEKIYIFIWFWLIIITIVSGLALIYRIIVLAMPKFRVVLIAWRVINTIFKNPFFFLLPTLKFSLQGFIFLRSVKELGQT